MEKKVLLIADDVEMNRAVIKQFLKSRFEIIEAKDGKETMDILQSRDIDALLLDIIMPEMDGLQILEILNEDEKYKKMGILVATSTREKTERKALSLGADDVVSKPYDPIVIQKRLDNILAMKESQKERNLLHDKNIDDVIKKHIDEVYKTIENSTDKLHKIAEIINKNKDNPKLLSEMVSDIHKETYKISDVLSLDV